MGKIALSMFLGSLLLTAVHGDVVLGPGSAYALEDDWKTEFDMVCSQTQDAMTYTPDQLKALIERCDAIKPLVEALQDPQRKVYLRRLALCRGLYAYVLELKEKE